MQSLNQSNIMHNKIEKAYAKINLNLCIINKRKDNKYNDTQKEFQASPKSNMSTSSTAGTPLRSNVNAPSDGAKPYALLPKPYANKRGKLVHDPARDRADGKKEEPSDARLPHYPPPYGGYPPYPHGPPPPPRHHPGPYAGYPYPYPPPPPPGRHSPSDRGGPTSG